MANYFDTGILLTAGFSLSSQAPLDGRSVVELLTDLDTHIAENRAYEGMCVYVKENKKNYIYNGTTWEEFVGGGSSSEKQIKDWVSGSSYLEGDYIYHEGEIYRCLTSNSDVDFDEANWEQVTYGIDELSKEDVERLLGLTEEELEAMASLISDTEVRIDKTYSSSKIYADIQQCLEDSKTYTLEEIAKIGTASYKIVTDVADMTEERYLYLLNDGATNYDIYVVEADGTPTKVGSTQIDLSSYYTKEEVDELLEANAVDLSGYVKTYTSLSELGLTEPVSVSEIFNAMVDNTTAMIACEDIANYITDVPMSYGILTIKKKNNSRFSIEYQNSLGGSATNVKRWIGTVKGNDGSGLYWKEMKAEVGVVITSDTITKYGTEILKYPVGTWRIDSTNIGNQFTDLPYANMAGVIEIDSIQPNKSPYEHAYGYRNYTFIDALNSTVYTRSLNSGNTIGTLNRDSGWCTTGSHLYKLTQMYLTTNATIQEVIDAVPVGSTAILRTDEFANWSTLFNGIQYGYFKVEKTVNGLSNIELQEVVVPNRRYFGTQSSGKFSTWVYDKAKFTAYFNSKTFKIDITKGNANWNGNMKFGYAVDNSYGEIIISSLGNTNLTWSCSDGVNYVKSVTYTIDPDNKAHVTIGVELHETVYGIHQLEMAGDFATINSVTADAFTGTSVAGRGTARGRNNGVGILCNVEDLGLTFPCTTIQIAQAMRNLANGGNRIPQNGMIGIFDNGGSKITDAPTEYGLLQVNAYGYDRVMIRYDGIASSNHTGSWIGQIKASGGVFSDIIWKRVCTTSVNDVPVTTVTTSNLSSNKITAGTVSYCVKNGVCYVYLDGIRYSEVGTNVSVLENMPKALITSGAHAGKSSSDTTLTQYCFIVKNETTLKLHCFKAGDTGYCSFSYPVAE